MPTPTNDAADLFDTDISPLVPHLSEYFGIWAIYDQSFRGMFQHYKTLDVRAHIEQTRNDSRERQETGDAPKPLAADFRRIGGNPGSGKQIAFIEITGPMMKFRSSLSSGVSTIQVRRQVRAAARDPEIGAIVLHFDTPGGTYAGTADLGADIAAAAAKKPTTAFVADMCASAGYWAASQANEIVATKTSMIGSIGTFLRIEDTSGAAAAEGIKVHVLRAGDFKGRTVEGVEVDAEALAEMQRLVTELNEFFVLAVADGRRLKLSTVREFSDGRVHLASEAQRLGLINRVSSLDDELARINQNLIHGKAKSMTIETPQTTAAGDDQQPATEQQPATAQPAAQPAAIAGDTPAGGTPAATLAELEAACPGADPAFILGQLKTGATTAAATRAFISAQQETITRLQQQPAVGTVTQPEPAAAVRRDLSSAGVDPLVTTGNNNPANDRSPVDQMRAYVRDKVAAGVPADKAMRMFHKENPELRQMAIEAANT